MQRSLIIPRHYTITFAGGRYEHDMPDHPTSRPLFPDLADQSPVQTPEEFFQTSHQKQLYAKLSGNSIPNQTPQERQ